MTYAEADSDSSGKLSESELKALTVAQIRAIAGEKGYTLTSTKKADLIAEFLKAQK